MKNRSSKSGFLMVEVLITIMILAVAFTVFLGAMAQTLRVSSKSSQLTDAISAFEPLRFELESGLRPDLVFYGGEGNLKNGYNYRIEKNEAGEMDSLLRSRFSWKSGKEFFDLEGVVPQAGVQ